MSVSNSIAAYDDCFNLFDRAINDRLGVRVQFPTKAQAEFAALRLHQARSLDRRQNERVYEKSDPKWGMSEYDKLIVRRPREDSEGSWWIYIERPGVEMTSIEALSELEE